jgi:hypothetical protein
MAAPSRGKSVDQLHTEITQLKQAVELLQSAIVVKRSGDITIKGKNIEIKASSKLTLKGSSVEQL